METCNICQKEFKTKWGLTVHSGLMHNSKSKRAQKKHKASNKIKGAVEVEIIPNKPTKLLNQIPMVIHNCPQCGAPLQGANYGLYTDISH